MYWFKEKDARKIIDKLSSFHGGAAVWTRNPMLQTWVRNQLAYYSAIIEPQDWETSLIFGGEQGELVKMILPKARQLIQELLTITTKEQLAFNAIATRQGRDVRNDLKLGNALAEQVTDSQRLDYKQRILGEQSMITGISFTRTVFRSDRGELYTEGKTRRGSRPLYTGETEISIEAPIDVLWNWRIIDWDHQPWVEVRTRKNRWDMAAQFPKMYNAIAALPSCSEGLGDSEQLFHTIDDDDFINVYEVYHRPCPALPKGRMIVYSDHHTIYYDDFNPYDCIPVEPMLPEPVLQTFLGYPMYSNLLPAQEMFDHSFSAEATNQSAFAVQNVLVPRGARLSVQDINGMNFIAYTPQAGLPGGGKPESLNLTQSSPQTADFAGRVGGVMEELAHLNGAIRGNPPPGVTAASAIATLTANALEFTAYASSALQWCMQRTMGHAFNAYKKFAKVEHKIMLVGPHFQAEDKPFTGADLEPIRSVKIVRANPLQKTQGGRSYLAETLTKSGLVKDVQKFIGILEGKPLETLYKPEALQNDLVEQENQRFMDGLPNKVLASDNHGQHALEHAALLNDVDIRMDDERVEEITDHILEHLRLAKDTDPVFMAMVQTGRVPEAPPAPAPKGDLPPVPGEGGPANPTLPAGRPANPAKDMLDRG